MNNKYKVTIIGAGSIGATKSDDIDSVDTESILTWAHAVKIHPKTELMFIVDIDIEKAKRASKKWGCDYDISPIPLVNANLSNIYIISVPTENHYSAFCEMPFSLSCLKLIICEKPYCNTIDEAEEISTWLKELNIPILVNYTRRFNKDIIEIKKAIDTEIFGKIFSTSIYYTRGLIRDGSHAIDLMRYWFGEFKGGNILHSELSYNDYSNKDRTYACYMSFDKCPHIFFSPIDGRIYDVFQIDIWTEKGRISLVDHGNKIKFYDVEKEPIYGNYNSIQSIPKNEKLTHLNKTLLSVLDNAIDHLNDGIPILCTDKDAIETHKIIDYLLRKK